MRPMVIAIALGLAGFAVTGTLAASASVPLAAFSALRSIDTEREALAKNYNAPGAPTSYYAMRQH